MINTYNGNKYIYTYLLPYIHIYYVCSKLYIHLAAVKCCEITETSQYIYSKKTKKKSTKIKTYIIKI